IRMSSRWPAISTNDGHSGATRMYPMPPRIGTRAPSIPAASTRSRKTNSARKHGAPRSGRVKADPSGGPHGPAGYFAVLAAGVDADGADAAGAAAAAPSPLLFAAGVSPLEPLAPGFGSPSEPFPSAFRSPAGTLSRGVLRESVL